MGFVEQGDVEQTVRTSGELVVWRCEWAMIAAIGPTVARNRLLFDGVLDSFSSSHVDSGASGTYSVSLLDTEGVPMLNGLMDALPVNIPSEGSLYWTGSDAAQVRPIVLVGLHTLHITATVATFGWFELRYYPSLKKRLQMGMFF